MFRPLFERVPDEELKKLLTEERDMALSYVRELYGDSVLDEELEGCNIAEILVAKRHAMDCLCCADTSQCPHSMASIIIRPVEYNGKRRFRTGAQLCGSIVGETEARNRERLFKKSRLSSGATFAEFDTMDNAELKAAKNLAQRCAREGLGLIIGGGVGCGKTHLATAIAMECMAHGYTAIFYLVPELFDQMRKEVGAGSTTTLDYVKDVDLLILDDLGVERNNEWTEERMYMLIDYRYTHNKQTVITTNATSIDHLKDMLGIGSDRICSRLSEMCKIIWVLNAGDYRKKLAREGGI